MLVVVVRGAVFHIKIGKLVQKFNDEVLAPAIVLKYTLELLKRGIEDASKVPNVNA